MPLGEELASKLAKEKEHFEASVRINSLVILSEKHQSNVLYVLFPSRLFWLRQPRNDSARKN